MRRAVLAVLNGLLLLLLIGCGSLPLSPTGNGNEYQVTDDQGTVIKLRGKPQRIMTTHFHLDSILLGVVPQERVVSVTARFDDPNISYAAPHEFEKPQRDTAIFPSMEGIVAKQPDLLIVRSTIGEEKIQSYRDMGIPVYVCEIPRDMEELKTKIRGIAAVTGEKANGELLIAKMTQLLEETIQEIPDDVAYTRSCVLVSKMNHAYGGKGCFFDEMCRLAKVRNAVADLGLWNGQEISKEIIVRANPDYLLTEGWGSYGSSEAAAREISEDPAFEKLVAVKEGHVAGVCSKYLYNSNQNCVYAVRYLANIVYGTHFSEGEEKFLRGY